MTPVAVEVDARVVQCFARGELPASARVVAAHASSAPSQPKPAVADAPDAAPAVPKRVVPALQQVLPETPPRGSASSHALDAYKRHWSALRRLPLLAHEEQVDLAKRAQAGRAASGLLARGVLSPTSKARLHQVVSEGRHAMTRLVERNLRLAVAFSRRRTRYLEPLDLAQEAAIGLMHAAERFDPARGYHFSTYATWWIRQAVSRAAANQDCMIRLPVHVGEQVLKLQEARHRLFAARGEEPSVGELAKAMHWSKELVVSTLRALDVASLDDLRQADGEEDADRLDVLASDPTHLPNSQDPDRRAEEALLAREVKAVLSELGPRESQVLSLRFGLTGEEPRTLEEVGHRFGVTRERIRQIEAKALDRLRQPRFVMRLIDFAELPPEKHETPGEDPPSAQPAPPAFATAKT